MKVWWLKVPEEQIVLAWTNLRGVLPGKSQMDMEDLISVGSIWLIGMISS